MISDSDVHLGFTSPILYWDNCVTQFYKFDCCFWSWCLICGNPILLSEQWSDELSVVFIFGQLHYDQGGQEGDCQVLATFHNARLKKWVLWQQLGFDL